jgi:sodium/proline symporter
MASTSVLLGLVGYLMLMIVVGIVSSRYMRGLDDYVLGGRRLGPWVAAISERASGESAWFLLGLPAAAYGSGFREYWDVIGIAAGILASWTFIAIPLRRETERLGALTLPDYFELRFKDKTRLLRILSMIVILFFYTAYVAAQLVGASKIFQEIFGLPEASGQLLCLGIGLIIVVAYTVLGGFLAVAWTDFIQGLLMTAVAVVIPIVGLIKIGGFSGLTSSVAVRGPEFMSVTAGQTGAAFFFGVVVGGLSWGFGYLGQPHLLTRYMAIRKTSELRLAGMIAMGWTLISYWGAPMIGIVGVAILGPDIADPDLIMPRLAVELLPGWAAGIMIAGATAAMMSTADSQLLVASSTLVEDIYVRLLRRNEEPAKLVLISRLATVGIALVAFVLALNALRGDGSGSLIDKMVSYAWTGLGASFGPALVLALWWKRTSWQGVLAGMVVGMTSTLVWQNSTMLKEFLDIKAGCVLLSAFFVVTVSLLTTKPTSSKLAAD